MDPSRRPWSREDVEAILGRALEREHGVRGELGHDELLAIGREIGLAESAVEQAAREVAEERVASSSAEERAVVVRELVRRARRAFRSHLFSYLVVIGTLAAFNAWLAPGFWLVAVPAGLWGIALALHGRFALFPDPWRLDARAKKLLARRSRRRELPGEVAERAGRELGEVVGRGVSAFLDGASPSTGEAWRRAKGKAQRGP